MRKKMNQNLQNKGLVFEKNFCFLILLNIFLGITATSSAKDLKSEFKIESLKHSLPALNTPNLSPHIKLDLGVEGADKQEKFLKSLKVVGQITGIEPQDYPHLKFRTTEGLELKLTPVQNILCFPTSSKDVKAKLVAF
jgi:hypothetical protein